MRPGIRRSRERARLAKDLGVNKSDIDKEIEARQAEGAKAQPLHDHWIVEPRPEPVDTDALLRDIIQKLRKHVIMPHDDALAIALWVMLAWVHNEVATHSPMLLITSAEPESGKTTTLSVVSLLVPRSIRSVEISDAALYRSIEVWHPTFVIDEFDNVLADDNKRQLRSVMNSGHTRGDGVLRVNKDTHEPELFPTFGPKVIGMVGRKLPSTTMSRCVVIELRRRKITEAIERFRHVDDGELANLRSRSLRWASDSIEALRNADPPMSEDFRNRHGDNWRIQFAIADLAGEDWGEQARSAALKVEASSDSRSASVRLLAAIKAISESTEHDAIISSDLVTGLTANPDSEWTEWKNGKPISQRQIANMLGRGRFGIYPGQVWIEGRQVRGYRFADFADPWGRYL
jgi:putative DNA primase/helicase